MYLNRFTNAQTDKLTVVVSSGSSVTLIVLSVSQPPVVEATVSEIDPGAVNTLPSKVYGNSFAQTAMFTVELSNGSSATVIVLMVSQPTEAVTVSVTEPGVVNICPSNV